MIRPDNLYYHLNNLQLDPVDTHNPDFFHFNFRESVIHALEDIDFTDESKTKDYLDDWGKSLNLIEEKYRSITNLSSNYREAYCKCLYTIRYRLMNRYINLIKKQHRCLFDDTSMEYPYHRYLVSWLDPQDIENYWFLFRVYISDYREAIPVLSGMMLSKLKRKSDRYLERFYTYFSLFLQLVKRLGDYFPERLAQFIEQVLIDINTQFYLERGDEYFKFQQHTVTVQDAQMGNFDLTYGSITLSKPVREKKKDDRPVFLSDYHMKEPKPVKRLDIPRIRVEDIKVRVKKKRHYEVPTC